jgi:hypothetical protein
VWEVVGGLLARQATLSTQLAMAPSTWNSHVAPILIRSMIDCYITLLWILRDPPTNAEQYILYGLGQQKLFIEHLRAEAAGDETLRELIKIEEDWLNSQRGEFATTVDVGQLGEKSTRVKAQEAGCEAIYNFPFSRFSGVAHNMWQHVARYNLQICENPLHKYHRVPFMPQFAPDIDWLYQSAKHLTRSIQAVDRKYELTAEGPMPLDTFIALFGPDGEGSVGGKRLQPDD